MAIRLGLVCCPHVQRFSFLVLALALDDTRDNELHGVSVSVFLQDGLHNICVFIPFCTLENKSWFGFFMVFLFSSKSHDELHYPAVSWGPCVNMHIKWRWPVFCCVTRYRWPLYRAWSKPSEGVSFRTKQGLAVSLRATNTATAPHGSIKNISTHFNIKVCLFRNPPVVTMRCLVLR